MLFNKIKHLRCCCSKTKQTQLFTTPIFYVNAAPHIGHLYSAVITDAICRYRKLRAPNIAIHFSTGTDEHGSKVQQAAAKHGVPVAQYCDDISQRYRQVFEQAHIEHTDFMRTTEQRHKNAVSHFWQKLSATDYVYSAKYSGWYCVSDETFLTDAQLRLDADTGARYSLESGHTVEWTEETNYMFRLSALQPQLLHWLRSGARIRPVKFEKMLFDFLAESLPDVSISRPAKRVPWAVPVPNDATQTVYVWLDALINYLTTSGYPHQSFEKCWPAQVQVIGKDILKFHGIYWPAFLMAVDLPPPQQLFVHSHWTVDGQKMSKSKHNVVDPLQAAQVYSMEGLRYFLLREGVAHSDGNYSNLKALRVLNSELADTLGNLLSRVCAKSLNPRQIYPRLQAAHLQDILRMDAAQRLQEAVQQLEARCAQHYEDNNFYLVVDTVMSTLHAANNFFESARPWELKASKHGEKDITSTDANAKMIKDANRLETIIGIAMDVLRLCGIILQPIVPQLSAQLLNKLSVPQQQRLWCNLSEHFAATTTQTVTTALEGKQLANTNALLFQRIILKKEAEEKEKQSPQQQHATSKAKQQKKKKQQEDKKQALS